MDNAQPTGGTLADRYVAVVGTASGAPEEFFRRLSADCGAAFFLLDPPDDDALAGLIESGTMLAVELVRTGAPILPLRVYLPPAGQHLTVDGGQIRLCSPAPSSHPLECFLRSLPAQSHGRTAVVALSGAIDCEETMASAVQRAGGLLLAANDAGPADAETFAQAVEQWVHGRADETATGNDTLAAILALVRHRAGTDLRPYKQPTLLRRIERRMGIARVADMNGYLDLLKQDPGELDCLAEDLLIGVTAFFRDTEAFTVFESAVAPALCGAGNAETPIRCWVAGCSTGEEAYSLAILLTEQLERTRQPRKLQIFATDIDADALDVARSGHYAEAAMNGVSEPRRQRFFVCDGSGYRIAKRIRESIVFAPHNLISDPPFSKLDLVICRNVLIYLNAQTQKKLLEIFHFILNPGGHLFLGSSESLGDTGPLFREVSKPWRIFQRCETAAAIRPHLPLPPAGSSAHLAEGRVLKANAGDREVQERLYRSLLERHAPGLIVADHKYQVAYISGNTQSYLEFPAGEPSLDLLKLIKPSLRATLRSALDRCRRETRKVAMVASGAAPGETSAAVRISVTPMADGGDTELLLISLEAEAPASSIVPMDSKGGEDWLLQQLERELEATREDLQRTIERTRSTTNELRAANEEVMAMNEELQSANEELESSKEELQSLNGELTVANAALDAKVMELESTSNDLNNVLVSTDLAILFLDRELNIRRYTPACNRLMHLIPSDIGRPFGDIVHHFADGELFADAAGVLAGAAPKSREILDHNGAWYLRNILPYQSRNNCCVEGLVITFGEVTSLKQAEQELVAQAAELRQQAELLKHAHVLARDLDDRVIFWNAYAEKFYGWSTEEALGRNSQELLGSRFPLPLPAIRQQVLDQGCWKGELIHIDRDGRERAVATHWELCRDAEGVPRAIVEVNNDITERNSFEAELHQSRRYLDYLAHHDPLTQLPNRLLFQQRLEQAVAQSLSEGSRLGLLFLDIDRFKLINDSLGHDIGDGLLLEVSRRLEAQLGPRDMLARIGGDEFAVLMEELDDIGYASRIAIGAIEMLKAPVAVDGHELFASVSGGISLFPEDSRDADGLLRSADAAMFLAKDKGRGNYEFFTPELNRRASRMLAIETRLRRAVENGELELAFQPQIDLRNGCLTGAEALARWNNPDLGQVPAGEFIQVAEESGLIVPLGEWAINTACRQIAEWQRAGWAPIRIAVNISAAQFRDPNFVRMIGNALAETGVNPAQLELELTERLLLEDVDAVVRTLMDLKRIGLIFSIDDFGTGYSSLSYLRRLPLNHLKVAREFVPWGTDDSNNLSISRAIVSLAKSLDLSCTVEGVETQAQLAYFRELGCDQAQGFLISKPLPVAEFEALLGRNPVMALR